MRIEIFGEEIECLKFFDPLTGEIIRDVPRATIYPKSHYVTSRDRILKAIEFIKEELITRLKELNEENRRYKGRSAGPGGITFVYGQGDGKCITHHSNHGST